MDMCFDSRTAKIPPAIVTDSSQIPIDCQKELQGSVASSSYNPKIDVGQLPQAIAGDLMFRGEGMLMGNGPADLADEVHRVNHGTRDSNLFLPLEPADRNQHFINQVAYSLMKSSELDPTKPAVTMGFDPDGNITSISFTRRPSTNVADNLAHDYIFKPAMGLQDRIEISFNGNR
jgi:hypothetical protein